MNGICGASYIREGKALLTELNEEVLAFGRVINIRFFRASAAENAERGSFTIRSDYEPVYHKDGTISFVPCTMKPSISFSYDQVANDTAIKVELRVDSLFIEREVTGEAIDRADGDPICWALVQLGYINQFPDWRQYTKETDLARFYDLDNNTVTSESQVLGGQTILVQILNSGPDAMAPERSWLFNGVVGTLENGLRWNHDEGSLSASYGNADIPSGMSEIETLLYHWITRRFIRSSVLHIATSTEKTETNGDVSYTNTVKVKGYKKYIYSVVTEDDTWTTLTPQADGLLSKTDALAVGVTCACSKKLREMSIDELWHYGLGGEKVKFTVEDKNPFNEPYNTLAAQIDAIRQHYPFLRWYALRDGTLFFYHVDEKSSEMFVDPLIKEKQLSGTTLIPAVYDITMSGLRVIRCPFFNVINPMTTCLFQSRYNITDITGFYAPKYGYDAFLVLMSHIRFSTVGDDNMMTLECVDIDDDVAPAWNAETGTVTVEMPEDITPTYSTNVTKQQEDRAKKWAEEVYTAGVYPFDKKTARWIDLAENLLKDADTASWGSTVPTLKQALIDLKSWNTGGAWTDAKMKNIHGYSPENRLDTVKSMALGFNIPWLYTGDSVTMRTPYKPASAYDAGYKEGEITL